MAASLTREHPKPIAKSIGEKQMGNLDDKVAIITGATSGIGARTVELFAKEGARVVLAGRREAEGEAIAARLGSTVSFRKTDMLEERRSGP
jgi:NADP-dependent 3-hydroxy acid dehydrogenase YdfG